MITMMMTIIDCDVDDSNDQSYYDGVGDNGDGDKEEVGWGVNWERGWGWGGGGEKLLTGTQ